MSLLDDLDAAEAPRVAGCKFCDLLASLPADERERVANSPLGADPLADLLTRNGYPISHHPIRRHRNHGHVVE